jgi:DNA mismatch repair protein MutS
LLTGPNMGGKSTFLRQNALICLMAQCGSFVPAQECELSPIDAIFTRIGASDDLCRDQSTFMLEMSETAHILRACTERSLLIIDEIGRGTSPQEGSALASAIAQYLTCSASAQPRTLFATHYHAISEHLPPTPAVQRLCTEADFDEEGGRIILIPSLRAGVQKHSFALPVAQLAGIPESIISQAKTLLYNSTTD